MDYTDESNSYGIRYKLTTIPQTTGPYRQNYAWADPCVQHLSELLQQTQRDPDEATRKGEAARERIRRDYSIDTVANIVSTRLQQLPLKLPIV
jgi:hypothetical protein